MTTTTMVIKNIYTCTHITHTTHTYPGEEEIEIKSFFRKYKLINNESAVWHAQEIYTVEEKEDIKWMIPEKKTELHTQTHERKARNRMLFHLFVDFCGGHYCCICCCWFHSSSSFSASSTSSLVLVNNPNHTHTYSHANTYKHGLNFNVKWRATKYNGNLSKFHYDIPLHNVIRAVVFFW